MATIYLLSFHKARRQWRKKRRIDGKDRYFYLGPSGIIKSDREAYRQAIAEWREIEQQLDEDAAAAEAKAYRTALDDKPLQVVAKSVTPEAALMLAEGLTVRRAERQEITIDPTGQVSSMGFKGRDLAAPPRPKVKTTGDLPTIIAAFISVHHRRQKVGDLSAGRFDQVRRDANHFLAWATERNLDTDNINAATIEDYHGWIMQEIADGAISRAYGRGRWVTLRMLIEWGWEREAWNLPRNLKARRFAITVPTRKVKTYPLDDLQEVMNAAVDKTQLYLLLMLNCGMYQSDISDLKVSEVKLGRNPRITRKRSKTGDTSEHVPEVSYTLWPITARLMKAQRGNDPERWLTNDRGQPLRSDTIDDQGKLRRLDAIRSAVRRTYLKINRARKNTGQPTMPLHDLKLIRKTGAESITQNKEFGGRIADLYLGHSPRSLREKHYSNAEQGKLDEAVKWLGEQITKKP